MSNIWSVFDGYQDCAGKVSHACIYCIFLVSRKGGNISICFVLVAFLEGFELFFLYSVFL